MRPIEFQRGNERLHRVRVCAHIPTLDLRGQRRLAMARQIRHDTSRRSASGATTQSHTCRLLPMPCNSTVGAPRPTRSYANDTAEVYAPAGTRDSAAAHEPRDCGHELVALVGGVVGFRAGDAMTGVVVEQAERDLVERGLHGGDLGEDVDAVTVVVDHALNAAYLAFDALETGLELIFRCAVPAHGSGLGRHFDVLE
jgi:hypothetical protein